MFKSRLEGITLTQGPLAASLTSMLVGDVDCAGCTRPLFALWSDGGMFACTDREGNQVSKDQTDLWFQIARSGTSSMDTRQPLSQPDHMPSFDQSNGFMPADSGPLLIATTFVDGLSGPLVEDWGTHMAGPSHSSLSQWSRQPDGFDGPPAHSMPQQQYQYQQQPAGFNRHPMDCLLYTSPSPRD